MENYALILTAARMTWINISLLLVPQAREPDLRQFTKSPPKVPHDIVENKILHWLRFNSRNQHG
jgi:hypothetical protein